MLSTQQRLAAALAVACLGLLAWTLFPPSGAPADSSSIRNSISNSNSNSRAVWLQQKLFPHASNSQHSQQQQQQQGRTFDIQDDRFLLDGQPVQLRSGSIHYFRIPPDQWGARLAAVQEMGLNAVQLYVPWNLHQPNSPGPQGVLPFEGLLDVAGFISTAHQLGLLVLLRPGPYICAACVRPPAEWEFGGLPAWLLQQNASMALRSSDPQFLSAVDDWWGVLLPALAGLTVDKGGPIVMVQVENEYGYYGHDKAYLRHLVTRIRQHMGPGVVLYTVDGASLLPVVRGTLPGHEVLTTVDFGPTTDVAAAFALQQRFNPPGKSPPFCVEYYTGWLTHYGEPMANTSTQLMVNTLAEILAASGGIGNFNLYMAAGGTNFGPWSGANLFDIPLVAPSSSTQQQQQQGHYQHTAAEAAAAAAGVNALLTGQLGEQHSAAVGSTASISLPGPEVWRLRQAALHLQQQLPHRATQPGSSSSSSRNLEVFAPHITSYDYHCPLGEAGTVGQVGVGGPNKFEAIRQLLLTHSQQPQAAAANAAVNAAAPSPSTAAAAAVGQLLPADLPPVPLVSYGPVTLSEGLYLTDALDSLSETCRGSTYASPDLQQQQGTPDTSLASPASAAGPSAASPAAAAAAAAGGGPVTSASPYPLPMEAYGQYYGSLVYSTTLGPEHNAGGVLGVSGASDTVWAYLDGQLLGHSFRSSPSAIRVPPAPFGSQDSSSNSSSSGDSSSSSDSSSEGGGVAESRRKLSGVAVSSGGSGRLLQLLVWQLGRNNFALAFGGQLADPKGLNGNVTLGGRLLRDWTAHHICMEHGTRGSSSDLDSLWRPLVPLMQKAAVAAAAAAAAAAADNVGGSGAGKSWGSSSSKQPDNHPQQHQAHSQHKHESSSSSSNDAQHRPFISSSAEAQAQAMIAAAAEAATGGGPATAAARGVATIRAGLAAAAAAGSNSPSTPLGRGALLLRGTLSTPPATGPAGTAPASTFLHMGGGWGRGEVWVNGNSLGRYWPGQGPQMTLYVPESFLFSDGGPSEVLVLELEGRLPVRGGQQPAIPTMDAPDFSGPPGGVEPL